MADDQHPVILTVADGVAEVLLNRPDRRNAINGPLGVALGGALEQAAADSAVRVVLLRGSGGAFCSGLDLDEFDPASPAPWADDWPKIWRRAHRALFDCPHPIVGALERYAINGGAALALAADLLITGTQAWLQIGEARQGMGAPYNLAWLRLRYPEALGARLALVGERHRGPELVQMGIAIEAVADDIVTDRARELAQQLATYPEHALRRIKAGLRAGAPETDADQWFNRFFASDPAPARTLRPRRQH